MQIRSVLIDLGKKAGFTLRIALGEHGTVLVQPSTGLGNTRTAPEIDANGNWYQPKRPTRRPPTS
jgi:hypothetical protein